MTVFNHAIRSTKANGFYLLSAFTLLNLPLLSSAAQANAFTYKTLLSINLVLCTIAAQVHTRAQLLITVSDLKKAIPIFIQAAVQLSLFIFIIVFTPDPNTREMVVTRLPFVFYQVFFAFMIDYLFQASMKKKYHPGFYMMPMVISINLLLWFIGNYAVVHLLLIVLGILVKNYVVRVSPDGKRAPIFNPSFAVLTLCFFGLILFYDQIHPHVYDVFIISIYENTPGFDLFIFFVGCITLWLPNSYLIAFGAYSIVMLLDALSQYFTGYILFYGLVHGSVMIAIMLGITDPTTSPKTNSGKLLFGASYGVMLILVGLVIVILDAYHVGTYFKIISLPILNLFTNKFDLIKIKTIEALGYNNISKIASMILFGSVFALTYERLQNSLVFPFLLQVIGSQIGAFLGLSHV